jgi:hypothetical protein
MYTATVYKCINKSSMSFRAKIVRRLKIARLSFTTHYSRDMSILQTINYQVIIDKT